MFLPIVTEVFEQTGQISEKEKSPWLFQVMVKCLISEDEIRWFSLRLQATSYWVQLPPPLVFSHPSILVRTEEPITRVG